MDFQLDGHGGRCVPGGLVKESEVRMRIIICTGNVVA